MRSTSNQSSDGGSYSDLNHETTTTTTTTKNRKVVKHGSFIIRKTVKREQSEAPTPTDDDNDDAMDERKRISRDQRNYISNSNNSSKQPISSSSSSSNQLSTLSYLSSFMDPIASLFGVKLRSTQSTSRRDCFAIDNEDDEERVLCNNNSIEHLSVGFDLNPHHSTPNTPRPSVNFKKQLYHFPSSLVDSPVAAVAAEEEEES